jgi:hypothetical protein
MNYGKKKIMLALLVGLTAVVAVLFLLSPSTTQATILTVNSTADNGPGTLRQALLDAVNGDIITFSPTVFPLASPVTITLTSSRLPTIITPNLTIDGSDAGVIIDGSQLSSVYDDGFRITSNNNTIRGLTIQNFPSDGVDIRDGAQGNRIENCSIRGNGKRGVRVAGDNTTGNTITQNNITNNDGSGIITSDGGNTELPPPIIALVVTSANTITITGFALPGVTIELFADPGGEGATFLDSTTADSDGYFTRVITEVVLGDDNVTATATDASANTSMFTCYPIPFPNLVWPLSGNTTPDGPFSSPFGPRLMASEGFRYDWHRGLDIPVPTGTLAYAAVDGKVRCAGDKSCGYSDRIVQLEHEDGCYYCNYLHLSTTTVITGDWVTQGETVGTTGASVSGFEHLHFEIRQGGYYQRNAINPFAYLPYDATNDYDYKVEISQVSVDPTSTDNPISVLLTVTGPRHELDLNRFTLFVDDNRRILDFNNLNRAQTNSNPEVLDNPYQNNICIMPARFNTSSDVYRLNLAFHQMPGNPPYTVTAQTADLFSNTVTATLLASSEWVLTPAVVTATTPTDRWVTHTHTLTNASPTPRVYTLTARSAQSWTVTIEPSTVALASGESVTFTTSISVPDNRYIVTGTTDCVVIEISVPLVDFYLPIIMKNFPATSFEYDVQGCLSLTTTTDDLINISVEGNDIVVHHHNAIYNCCATIVVDFVGDRPLLKLIERETYPGGYPCFCMCPYNISARIPNLPPGNYQVEVWNQDQSHRYGWAEVTVP